MKETEKRAKQQGKGADGGQQLQTVPSSDPHTFLEFDDEELRRGSDDKEQLIVQRGDLGIYTVTLEHLFYGPWNEDEKKQGKKEEVTQDEGEPLRQDEPLRQVEPTVWYWKKQVDGKSTKQQVTGQERQAIDLDGARAHRFQVLQDHEENNGEVLAEMDTWRRWYDKHKPKQPDEAEQTFDEETTED